MTAPRRNRVRPHFSLLVALTAACGDNAPVHAPHSGARLQIATYRYNDGAEQIDRSTLYDDQLETRCRATTFSDGARYCMPADAGGETVFIDDRCTRSLGRSRQMGETDETEPPSYFIGYYRLGGEARPSRIHEAGASVDPPVFVWRQQDSYCLGPIVAEPGSYFEVKQEIRPEALARITETRQVAGSKVAIGIDTSDDGLVATSTLYDLVDGPCDLVTEAGATEAVCIARSLAQASYYADAACTVPVVALTGSESADRAAYHDPRTGCWSTARIEPTPAAAPLYERIDRACISVTPPAGATLHALGPPMAPPALARVRASSGSRLDVMALVDGAVHLPSTHVFDNELGVDCTPQERDGEIVCVPDAPINATTVFADDICGTPIELAFVATGICQPVAAFAARGTARHPIEAPYTQPFYELEPGDRCGAFAAPLGHVAHALGPAIPAEAFARATVTR